MRWTKEFFAGALAALAVFPQFAGAAGLTLAENGRTAYRVVGPKSPSETEKAAVADLAATLHAITGADFASPDGKTGSIFVGAVPPCDREPLKENERRIATCDGNVYLYGEGKYGNVNAVYDFLRDVLGCRWYNVFGDNRIPRRPKLVLDELKRSVVPSIPRLSSDAVDALPGWADFGRRNALCDKKRDAHGPYSHAGQSVIPSGLIPVGGRIGNTHGPYPLLKDKAYFKEHPEYFSMDGKGRRVVTLQLCYSNMAMRDEFARNIMEILDGEKYDKDTTALISFGQDDNGGVFCCCPGCRALEKKYGHPAGAYYDFLLDMARRFGKTHPKLLITFLAYRDEQTLRPAECMKKLPGNLLPSFAPLGADFAKPYDHKVNKKQLETFKAWAGVADKLQWWSYPTTYLFPVPAVPLGANIRRLAENFRIAHENKVFDAYCQFGAGPFNAFGFNDIRLYMLCELCRDITLDETKIVEEYTDFCHGKAAPLVRKYLAELEKLDAGMDFYLRWNPDILSIPYVTGENLVRWERDFEKMEKLVADEPRHLFNVRRVRWNLDQTVIAKWPYLTKTEQKALGDLESYVTRTGEVIDRDHEELLGSIRESDPVRYKEAAARRRARYDSGLEQYIARARGGKALPERYAKRKVYRVIPSCHRGRLVADADAAFGLCNRGAFPKSAAWFTMRHFNAGKPGAWESFPFPKPFGAKSVKRPDGKYLRYYLGDVTLSPDSQLSISPISRFSSIALGHLYDPKRPKRLYSLVVSLAADPERKWVKIDELWVLPTQKNAAKPRSGAADDKVDAFF